MDEILGTKKSYDPVRYKKKAHNRASIKAKRKK